VSRPQQLHLPLEVRREPALGDFVRGSNAEAVAAAEQAAAGEGELFVFLAGPSGSGKTHLLQGACLAAAAVERRSHYCPLGFGGVQPDILDGLEHLDLVALDGLERIAGQSAWERGLFDLFNRMRERNRTLIVAAAGGPEELGLGLPDLRSRLQWGPLYRLRPLDDSDCEALLLAAAASRGLALGPELVRYIMTRSPRDPRSLLKLLARVDALSLREQRQPTIPLVRRALSGDL
jgi:DnaA-homolog protein